MKILLNNHTSTTKFEQALAELSDGADTLSAAVSYLQVGGWELFQKKTTRLNRAQMRMVCTDQMNITHPEAVKRAITSGIQIRNFTGDVTYHPKVFLAYRDNRPIRFLLGSANLSVAAFSNSVEAGILCEDSTGLNTLHDWFTDLFQNKSTEFTPDKLRTMEQNWRVAAARRAHSHLGIRREQGLQLRVAPVIEIEDLDTLEDVFSTIQLPIGLLNMDYAGNNIRNVAHVREVLGDWITARSAGSAASKKRSEMRLLGFADGYELTELGRRAAALNRDEEVATLWCKWLQQTPKEDLDRINRRLSLAKRVFPRFWQLKGEVREYFLANAQSPTDRLLFQTIEFLCNATDMIQELSLEDMRTLSPLMRMSGLPQYIKSDVDDYFLNKGNRSWDSPDRKIMPIAWQQAERS